MFYTIYGRDLDNNFKVLFDSLVKAKIIDDDKEIMKITAVKKIVKNIDSKCELIIKQYTEWSKGSEPCERSIICRSGIE